MMLYENRQTYITDLKSLLYNYAAQKGTDWADTLDAADIVLDELYFNVPRANKDEVAQLLKDYAADKGASMTDILDALIDTIEDIIAEKIAEQEAAQKRKRRKK